MAKETPPFTWTGWGLTQAADYATAASTYLQNLSQAKDLQERALAHSKFVKMQIEKCDERAKGLSDALAAANNFVGGFVSLFQLHKDLDEQARNSPTDRKTGGNGRKRRSSAKRSVRQSAAKRTGQRATSRGGSKSRVKRRRR
jgi:hypothetical protein